MLYFFLHQNLPLCIYMFRRSRAPVKIDSRLGKKLFTSFLVLLGVSCGLLQLMMGKLKEKCKVLLSVRECSMLVVPVRGTLTSRGCVGCFRKPPSIIAVDQPSKGLKIQGRAVNKQSISEGFWSTSPREVDSNSAVPSLRSVSSMSTSNPTIDLHTGGSTSNPSEFVNHGLLLWNQTRQQWSASKNHRQPKQVQESKLSPNATYESLLGTNKPFPHPIPLSEMVDFLVDVWEQEGLYD